MKKTNISALCMIATLISFAGFIVENIWLIIVNGYINNRNMILPFLLGYGITILVLHAMFGTPRVPRLFAHRFQFEKALSRITVFFCCVSLCVMVGEASLGLIVEKLCGFSWWDYTNLPLHITKYTSVPTTIGFGAMITVFMLHLFDPLYRLFSSINKRTCRVLATVFITLLLADFIHSGIRMFLTHGTMLLWKIYLR